jgi:tol-pal system protein YbgF
VFRPGFGRRAASVLLLGASACWVPLERGREMEARIQRLEGETSISAKQLEEQRAVMRERIAAVDAKIAELNTAAHRTGADLSVNQDRLQEEVARLRGMLEETTHKLEALEQAIAQQKSENDARFAALKGAGALDEFEAKKKLEGIKRPADKAEFFALAQSYETKGDRAVARALYEEFAKKWPNDPRTADADFRIGEILYGDRRYREAILLYGKVVQDFPRSDKAPDALLRTGESMLALDLKEDAHGLFQEVVKRYPKSSAAQRAKARLADMAPKRRQPKPKRPAAEE